MFARFVVGRNTIHPRSQVGMVAVSPACGPGCCASRNQNSENPGLTANDLACFLNRFASRNPYANGDGSTAAPTVAIYDAQCLIHRFATGRD